MAILSKAVTTALALALPGVYASAHKKSSFAVMHFGGDGPLAEGRMDPVINPGAVSGHVHTVQGGNAFALEMGNDFASAATCTTARVNKDLSNYWAPKLYFQSPENGTFYDVPLYYMNVYYFFDNTDDDLKPFPQGFRMVSGDPELRSVPHTSGLQLDASKGPIQPISWTCPQQTDQPPWPTNSNGLKIGMAAPHNSGEGVGFPNKNCDGKYSPMRSNIHFPSCYNPKAGLDNYKENTAWPSVDSKTGNSNCPEGYIHVPHIFYELYWNTMEFAGQWKTGGDSQPFVLANGDPTGYSLHADFISGWDEDALQWAIDNCNGGDAGFEKCPGIPGGVTTSGKIDCHVKTPFDETITGALKALPGCNPVTTGPGNATMVKDCNVKPQIKSDAKGVLSGTKGSDTSGSGSGASDGGSQGSGDSATGEAAPTPAPAATTTLVKHHHSHGSQSSPTAQALKVDNKGNVYGRRDTKVRRRSQHLDMHRRASE